MSSRIDPSKPLNNEIRRIGTRLIDEAMDALSQQPDGPHAAVHAARKKFKRLRGLYRFVQSAEPKFRSEENRRFGDIARTLSKARDAAALVETVEYLQGFDHSEAQSHALTSAHDALTKRRDAMTSDEGDLATRIEAALTECEKGKHALEQLSLPSGGKTTAKLIRKTWSKQRKRALDALNRCHGRHGHDIHDEDFHDLRKSGQVYWMHLALLRKLWPSAMRAKKIEAKHLVDLLGHEHDLSVLKAFVEHEPEQFESENTRAALLETVTHRQQTLRAECLDLADHVFAESAKSESGIIGLLWEQAAR